MKIPLDSRAAAEGGMSRKADEFREAGREIHSRLRMHDFKFAARRRSHVPPVVLLGVLLLALLPVTAQAQRSGFLIELEGSAVWQSYNDVEISRTTAPRPASPYPTSLVLGPGRAGGFTSRRRSANDTRCVCWSRPFPSLRAEYRVALSSSRGKLRGGSAARGDVHVQLLSAHLPLPFAQGNTLERLGGIHSKGARCADRARAGSYDQSQGRLGRGPLAARGRRMACRTGWHLLE
jgi:hypothetical protein